MPTLDQILAAKTFHDLFTEGSKKELRQLLKKTHPDMHPADAEKAERAFVHVNLIWSFKDTPTITTDTPKASVPENTIITKKHEYTIISQLRKSTGTITYQAKDETGKNMDLTIATDPKISPLLMNGIKNLKTVKTSIPEEYKVFFSETSDAFHIKQDSNGQLSGVAQPSTANMYSLTDVKEDYPNGIDGRDVAWMFRRMLVAVGNAHDSGIMHGAPTADAFLIFPDTHEVRLINWHFSQPADSEIKIVIPEVKHHYETDRKMTIAKDLKIMSETAYGLLNDKAPKRLRGFLNGMKKYPTNNASEGLYEFDELLKELYGPRKFHEFRMKRWN
jgi:hypothetical protein